MFITAFVGNCSYAQNLDVQFRVAYFTLQDSHFRKTYHTGWADYQIEAGSWISLLTMPIRTFMENIAKMVSKNEVSMQADSLQVPL